MHMTYEKIHNKHRLTTELKLFRSQLKELNSDIALVRNKTSKAILNKHIEDISLYIKLLESEVVNLEED